MLRIGPKEDEARRRLGAVQTPPELARRLVRRVMQVAGADLPPGPVYDPATGEGALLAAWRAHEAETGEASRPLIGCDLDPDALARTRARLDGLGDAGTPTHLQVADAWAWSPLDAGMGPPALVLANPPWLSLSGRQRGRSTGQDAAQAGRAGAWPALHTRLALAALDGLAPGGYAGFVLPAQVADLAGYGGFRRAWAERVRLVERVGEGAFPGVVSPTCLVVAGPPSDAPLIEWVGDAQDELPRAWLRQEPAAPWRARVRRLMTDWPPPGFRLAPGAFADCGLHSGNQAARLFADQPFAGSLPVLEGRDVHAFGSPTPRRWFDPEARPGPGEVFSIGRWRQARACPLLLRQTADRPVAARNPGLAFRNSVLGCRGVPGLPDAVVLALLNSAALARLYRALCPDSGQRAFPQVKIGVLARLPWPRSLAPAQIEALAALARAFERTPPDARAGLQATLDREAEAIYQPVLARLQG